LSHHVARTGSANEYARPPRKRPALEDRHGAPPRAEADRRGEAREAGPDDDDVARRHPASQ